MGGSQTLTPYRRVRPMDKTIANARTLNITQLEEGLGRVMYVAGALEHDRLFLGTALLLQVPSLQKARVTPPHGKSFMNCSPLRG